MAQITAALVKELRVASGAGMMDCKKALTECDGDITASIDWLRAKGFSKAAKKSGRVAAEGLIALAGKGASAGMIELNSETDFVSRNADFQAFALELAAISVVCDGDLARIHEAKMASGSIVSEALTQLISTIGENMNLRRAVSLSVEQGVVATYVHNAVADDMGSIGVLVSLQSSGDADKLTEIGRKIAMHIAATSPLSLKVDDLDPAAVERERAVLIEQAKDSGKPDNIIEKMVEGRINKFFSEVVLLKQTFVMDPDLTIEKFVQASAKDLGTDITLAGFARLTIGEGIEKVEEDFAAEVAAVGNKG
ncbi:Translation elongation factor Ts [hydrothermal vent metagenome]|uniref:Translation elongation factor Ts n=1 Tax=hydrothermal vent metagenome TaxID=652676 RepID=A0A3B0RK68_9ZZZZ